ncbi:MAG TPA: TraB/GumN family protein [Phnomibacter sp.]|nr:TraB/GumN family protein [Phnomibacter sp.]
MLLKNLSTYLLLLIVVGCKAQPAQLKTADTQNSLLWEISGKGLKQPSYYLGTMHILCAEDAFISNQLEDVLDRVAAVYLEIDLDDMGQMLSAMKAMQMKDGKTLKDILPPSDYEKVAKFFDGKSPLPFKMLESYQPLLLSSMVAEDLLQCKNTQGMEMLLMDAANKRKLPINGLETMLFQLSLFDSIPYAEQAKDLMKTIDSLPQQQRELSKLLEAYRTQNLDAIEKLTLQEESGLEGNLDLLLYGRNRNWVAQFDSIASSHSVLFGVGAGHLPGEQGVLALLKKQGYTIRPLENKTADTKKSH